MGAADRLCDVVEQLSDRLLTEKQALLVADIELLLAERDALAAQVAAMRNGAESQVRHLELAARQLREQGDVRQVELSEDGVGESVTLADELWLIAYNLRAALDADQAPPTEEA